MSNLHLASVLAFSAVLSSCASGPIAEITVPQDPPRTVDPAPGTRTTTPPRTTPPRTTTTTTRTTTTSPRTDMRTQEPRTRLSPEDREMRRREWPWEVTLSGGGFNDENFDVGSGQLSGSVGYYFSEWTLLALRHGISYSDDIAPAAPGGSAEDVWNFQTRIAFDVHFPIGPVVPYVGALLGYIYGDSDALDDTFALGPEAGVKIYVKEDAFIQLGAEWTFFTDRSSDATVDDVFEDGQIFYFAGIGLRF